MSFLLDLFSVEGKEFVQNDSLAAYSYLELDDKIYEHRKVSDSLRTQVYLDYYLYKARKENNPKELANYYKNYVFYLKEENRLYFVDSALHYAYRYGDKSLIGDTYIIQGTAHIKNRDYRKALTSYLSANEYISQTDDLYNKYNIQYLIAGIKNYLGYYEEAALLFEECVAYYGQDEHSYNMQRGYVSSMEGLAWSHTQVGRLAESEQLLATARASAEQANFSKLDVHYLKFKQGINDYLYGRYDLAIQKITENLPALYQNEDFAWGSIGEYYIGKAYWDKGDRDRAIGYFKKIDSVFIDKGYTHPDLRGGYELLIRYYRDKGDKDQQIRYIEQLVKADSVLDQDHKHLLSRIHKEYSTKDLIQAKAQLENALYLEKHKSTWIAVSAVLLLTTLIVWMVYRQRKSKKLAQELILKIKALQAESISARKKLPTKKARIKDAVVQQLLDKLDEFEQKHQFLQPDISLEKLADNLNTNTAYLSSVINSHKEKTFSEYINALRIEYVSHEMVENKQSILFKYSLDVVAKEIGFNSLSALTRAFQKHTGVMPATFIKALQEDSWHARTA